MKNDTVVDRKSETTSAQGAKAIETTPVETKLEEKLASTGFIADLESILESSKSRTSNGKVKISPLVGYTLVPAGVRKLVGTAIPGQEQVLLRILSNALTAEKPVISEPELHKLVVAAHKDGTLATRQDPWHIFRYYRTDLTKKGALRSVTIAAAPEAPAVGSAAA